MKLIKSLLSIWTLAACMSFTVVSLIEDGCANTPTDPGVIAYDTEKVVSDGAKAATHVFNLTYPTDASPSIASTRQQLYAVDKSLELSLLVVDSMRTNYTATGSTNASLAAAITATLATAQSQYSTITNLVNSIK